MDNYLTVIKKYLEGDISPSDREALQQWLAQDPEHEILFKQEIKNWYATNEELPADPNFAYDRFLHAIDKKETKVIKPKSWSGIVKYAAVLGGVLLGGYYYTTQNVSTVTTSLDVVEANSLPVDKIKIVQADGTVTYTDFNDKADIINASGNLIGKKNQDQFIVQPESEVTETRYIEISIPKGKLFQLTLSDGTKVWLNAASSLKFPQHFTSTKENRIVYLKGEAFFDVTKNKAQPFIVKTETIDVEVLGTQFNVSSYTEDATVKTTLVEGAVVVNDQNEKTNSLQLVPNDQAIFSKDKKVMHKQKVNTSLYTSWMDKKIILQNESFIDAFKRIERSYDVSITSHNNKLNNTRFTGEFDVENIEEILKTFSETLKFTYEIKGKDITINP
ncbi:ferric-dicitrate binding protein FerR (iron transport regulator) [Aquimarina sp. EL_43]|uniref:FecR domain-containing protein n=1 Tax=unclassified Aquimarina TaxID=2627091 RepID=UPI0018CAEE48|nr:MULTISPECIES: FecR domain-containing protein [unclassified Aquimarina]MBG6128859.1 ferric-dicitrate binding protein FerR (iron transport regulator) [Aquimarina sp. EL_35]MBG6149922.1 ferric-dicitrate binding protein FerR (iron transport regulator) [Aquimarina sp. EL_32]MBG6167391.1 ferric-dicitrate binding protein FerR (iron transport regulator) [Aquimarina sp. EL_43]